MLSVIVDARGKPDRLAGLLAVLTPAAVEGLVREVIVVAQRGFAEAEALCEATGAGIDYDLAVATARAKADWLLAVPAEIRFRDGWIERLSDHLASGPRAARVAGIKPGGLLARRPCGVLIRRSAASGLSTLEGLRREQGADRIRLD